MARSYRTTAEDEEEALAYFRRRHDREHAKKDTVVLTRRGKPVAALAPVDTGQREDWVVSTNPDFIEIIKRSEARYKAERGISMDEIRRKYGLERKPVR